MKRKMLLLAGVLLMWIVVGCGGGGSISSPISAPGGGSNASGSGAGSTGSGQTSGSSGASTSSGSGTGTGGGTSQVGSNPSFPSTPSNILATVLVKVDLTTRQVTYTPVNMSGGKAIRTSRALFSGSTSSVLFSGPNTISSIQGDPEVYTMALTITNNYGLPIGQQSNGVVSGLKAILMQYSGVTGANVTEPIQLSNADGTIPSSGLGANQPYINYGALGVAPGSTSQIKNWNFVVPAGITGFSFTVLLEGATANEVPPGAASGAGSASTQVRTLAGLAGAAAVMVPGAGLVDGIAQSARFSALHGLAVDSSGIVYVTDANSVRRISPSGVVTTIANPFSTGGANNGAGNAAQFNNALGIVVNPAGNTIYVCDANNNQIRRMSLASGTGVDPTLAANWSVSVIAGSIFGMAGGTDGFGNAATFSAPTGITLDPFGNVFVTESAGNRVRRVLFKGGDPTNAANWYVQVIAGTGSAGSADGAGSSASFNAPTGITSDRAGTLYVTDSGNHTIRSISSSGNVTTIAGAAGQPGYTDNASGALARFNKPTAIVADGAGYLYVCDNGNLIRRVGTTNSASTASSQNAVETVAGSTSSGAVDGAGNTSRFNSLFGIGIDLAGNLYVADSGNFTVRMVERYISSP